jgi:hypothetical protein
MPDSHSTSNAQIFLDRLFDGRVQVLGAIQKVVRAGDIEEDLINRIDFSVGCKPKPISDNLSQI